MGRAILAVIGAAVAVVGMITFFRLVCVVTGKILDKDGYEPAEDLLDKIVEAIMGAAILLGIASVLTILYLLGTKVILPVFGL